MRNPSSWTERAPRRSLLATLLSIGLLAVLSACSERAGPTAWLERDSAGIHLITLHPDRFDDTLSLEPVGDATDQPPFGDLADVGVTSDGGFVALDALSSRVMVFDEELTMLRILGDAGVGPGEFRPGGLSSLALQGDTILIPDLRAAQVTLYDLHGTFLGTIPMTTDETISIEWGRHPDGGFVFQRSGEAPALIRMSADGAASDTILTFPPEVASQEPGPLAPFPVWCVLEDHRVAWGSTTRYEIKVSEPGRPGPALVLRAPMEPEPVTEEDRSHLRALLRRSVESRGGAADPARIQAMLDQVTLPEMRPAIAGLICDGTDRIWIQLADPVREMELDALRVGTADGWGSGTWHVVDLEERVGQVVRLPDGALLTRVTDGELTGIVTDERGVERIGRWRLER